MRFVLGRQFRNRLLIQYYAKWKVDRQTMRQRSSTRSFRYAERASARVRRLVYDVCYRTFPVWNSARVGIRGSKVVVDVRPQEDEYQRSIYLTRTYERGTLELIRDLLNEGDIFIDIGANLGIMTLVASENVGPNGHVLAFEPSGRIRERFLKNIALNDVHNVTPYPYALGAMHGSAFLWNSANGNIGESRVYHSAKSGAEQIEIRTLDELVEGKYAPSRIRVIKIDVEGNELDVLRGAVRILESATNVALIVENNDPEVFNFLKQRFSFKPMRFLNSKFSDAQLCIIDDPSGISSDENIVYIR
jgi:FkbM family methyltransferase